MASFFSGLHVSEDDEDGSLCLRLDVIAKPVGPSIVSRRSRHPSQSESASESKMLGPERMFIVGRVDTIQRVAQRMTVFVVVAVLLRFDCAACCACAIKAMSLTVCVEVKWWWRWS